MRICVQSKTASHVHDSMMIMRRANEMRSAFSNRIDSGLNLRGGDFGEHASIDNAQSINVEHVEVCVDHALLACACHACSTANVVDGSQGLINGLINLVVGLDVETRRIFIHENAG